MRRDKSYLRRGLQGCRCEAAALTFESELCLSPGTGGVSSWLDRAKGVCMLVRWDGQVGREIVSPVVSIIAYLILSI